MRISIVLLFCVCLVGHAASCDNRVCQPGKQDFCACPGGTQGVQVCREDASGWKSCNCGKIGDAGSARDTREATAQDTNPTQDQSTPDNTSPQDVPAVDKAAEPTTPDTPQLPELPQEKASDKATPNTNDGPLRAFPGAVGFGAVAKGGRGGKVLFVENLNDAGPGSLRAAIDATGPRIVIFRVGGTITLNSSLNIKNPFITIAGQTAPGDGILLRMNGKKDGAVLIITTNDVIVRYLRIRPGPGPKGSINGDGVGMYRGASRIVLDHLSVSWTTDEVVNGWYDAHDFTIQNSILGGALDNSSHQKGPHGYGPLIGSDNYSVTLYQNLFLHNTQRNPSIALKKSAIVQVINNVNYNCKYFQTVTHGGRINVIGNYYKAGPDTRTTRYEVDAKGDPALVQLFVKGNIGWHRKDASQPDWAVVGYVNGGKWVPAPTSIRVNTPFKAPSINALSANDAYNKVLQDAGATLPKRDAIDIKYINEVKAGNGKIIDHPSDIGGYPTLKSGTPPADQDKDGMPDAWEQQHGFNPKDPSDANQDRDKDGYTNIEEYLNNTRP